MKLLAHGYGAAGSSRMTDGAMYSSRIQITIDTALPNHQFHTMKGSEAAARFAQSSIPPHPMQPRGVCEGEGVRIMSTGMRFTFGIEAALTF